MGFEERAVVFVHVRAAGCAGCIDEEGKLEGKYGTGFHIFSDERHSYFATCAHVVDECGERPQVVVVDSPSTLFDPGKDGQLHVSSIRVILGNWKTRDLAIIVTEPVDLPTLELMIAEDRADDFFLPGWSEDKQLDEMLLYRKLIGKLSGRTRQVAEKGGYDIQTWDLGLDEGRDRELVNGYSGCPVVHRETGRVVAIVARRPEKPLAGFAIDVGELRKVWKEMPDLFRPYAQAREMSDVDQARRVEALRLAAGGDTASGGSVPTAHQTPAQKWKHLCSRLHYLDMDEIVDTISAAWKVAHSAVFVLDNSEKNMSKPCCERFRREMSHRSDGLECLGGDTTIDPQNGVDRGSLLRSLALCFGVDPKGLDDGLLASIVVKKITSATAQGSPYFIPIHYVESFSGEAIDDLFKWFAEVVARPLDENLKSSPMTPRCYFLFVAEKPLDGHTEASVVGARKLLAGEAYDPQKALMLPDLIVGRQHLTRWLTTSNVYDEPATIQSFVESCSASTAFADVYRAAES
ncbi:MAG TPA: serine protease, partial [Fimbriimonadaceae bacterium]|nr:serine protease [Fimbriimonadaceae bacterium]